MLVGLSRAIDWSPFGVFLEQTHGFDVVIRVQNEAMVRTGRQNDHIAFHGMNSDPFVVLVANIKVTRTFQYISNLLIIMDVFCEECLELLFIVGQLVLCNTNLYHG